MLDGNEKQNFYSLMRLRDLVIEVAKPLVFWVGGGASRWCGYPSWEDLAAELHSSFSKYESRYDPSVGAQLLAKKELPAVFGRCRGANSTLYHQSLASALSPRPSTPVYDNFLHLLSAIKPLHILTTNVDEALEQHIPSTTIVQRTDFERCIHLIQHS